MTTTDTLLGLLQANDERGATALLDAHPHGAGGRGPAGESPILIALYAGMTQLAHRVASMSPPDVCEAAALGDEASLGIRLQQGESATSMSFDGWTALHLAAFMGHAGAIRLLVAHGAAVDALSANAMANTPLCAALAGRGDGEAVRCLLDIGADVNVRVAGGVTPLHLAASRGAQSLVETLLQRGANAGARLDDGITPAELASARGHDQTAAVIASCTT